MTSKRINLTRNDLARNDLARNGRSLWMRPAWFCLLCGMAAIAMLPVVFRVSAQGQAAEQGVQNAAGGLPANAQSIAPAVVTAVADSQKDTVADAANLLKMAADLKAEVDKTSKDTLSVAVVRKAGEIEQLAHKVRTK